MKKNHLLFKIVIFLCFPFISATALSQNAWINEIHYDNAGGDVDEVVEVVIENPGNYNLADFEVYLYNGSSSSGASYDNRGLDTYTAGSSSGGFTIYYLNYTAAGSSIQNGSPDGIALAYQGTLVPGQFLSYEGSFTAVGGPADGLTSTDIGVEETGSTPVGHSLQLTGTGTSYVDFSWLPPDVATTGNLNNGQSIGAPDPEPSGYPTVFAADPMGVAINLTWTDATGTQLPAAYLVKASDQDNISAPLDGTPEADDTDLSDGSGALNVQFGEEMCTFYRLMAETEYFFKIFPYTNAGGNIDYKTDGTPPSASAFTDAIINTNDFESGDFGTWTSFSVASGPPNDWAVLDFGGALGTVHFAEMNGYQENEPSNDWLISPALNLNSYSGDLMYFFTQWRFGNTFDELTLKYSTDYAGGDPTLATWTDLSFDKPQDQSTWGASGEVDLSALSGDNVSLAFQYLSSGSPRRWDVDEIAITGIPIVPVLMVTSPSGGEFWEQGTAHNITWDASNTLPNVMIELTLDASSGNPGWTVLNPSVPASQGSWTWNISPTQQTSNDCQIRISDVASSDVTALSGIFSLIEPIYVPDLVINEIMYNPPEEGNDSLEYIEIFNNDPLPVDLEGYYFANGIEFTFPSHTIQPGEFVVVAINSGALMDFFGVDAYQWTSGGLSNNGEIIRIKHPYGPTVDSVEYDDTAPWPTEADNHGPSLVICDPDLDNSDGANWTVSAIYQGTLADGDTVYGSPGIENCIVAPVPDFSADNTSITTGGSVNFADETTGEPDSWVWTFIGGEPANYIGQNPPPITYNTPGSYTVALFVENIAGSGTETKTDFITVGAFPTANFMASEDTILTGTSIDFTDLSLGDPDSWTWTFEGGTPGTSGDQNPSGILYDTPGSFDVTLVVENEFGTDTYTIEDYILVGDAPVADFEASADTILMGETVDFTDLSQNNPLTWLWTFDGATPFHSTEQNPMGVKYDDEGVFDVSLVVENEFGESFEIKTGYIVVVNPVGIREPEGEKVSIFPNPSGGIFNIRFESPELRFVKLYSVVGTEIASLETADPRVTINVAGFGTGIYFIRITDAKGKQLTTEKIIIR